MSGILSQRAAKKSNISLRELLDVNEGGLDFVNNRPDNIEHNMVLTSYNVEGRPKEFIFKNLTDLIKPGSGVTITEVDGVLTLSSTGGGGLVTNVTATAPLTSSGGTTPDISTLINTNRLVGRTTAGSGVMEEISVGLGLQLSGGELKDIDFDFSLNFQVVQPYTIILPYNFRIDTVDDPTPISYTITVNALPYTLGTLINAQNIVVVTPGAIGWINLNCTKLS